MQRPETRQRGHLGAVRNSPSAVSSWVRSRAAMSRSGFSVVTPPEATKLRMLASARSSTAVKSTVAPPWEPVLCRTSTGSGCHRTTGRGPGPDFRLGTQNGTRYPVALPLRDSLDSEAAPSTARLPETPEPAFSTDGLKRTRTKPETVNEDARRQRLRADIRRPGRSRGNAVRPGARLSHRALACCGQTPATLPHRRSKFRAYDANEPLHSAPAQGKCKTR